jgi:hypothetical protein
MRRKKEIKPSTASEIKPPELTTALNTRSENRGSVVISRGSGAIVGGGFTGFSRMLTG